VWNLQGFPGQDRGLPPFKEESMQFQILQLDVAGVPRRWSTPQEAIEQHAKGHVVWSLGDPIAVFRGGFNKDGVQSILETPPIIAVRGTEYAKQKKKQRIILTNRSLFQRDQNMCAYCGECFNNSRHLSRDHIMPVSRGGENTWMNCVTACVPCNIKKDNKTPQEAGMELLYVPYEPNHYENLILKNRNVLDDQMEYLLQGVPEHSRIRKMKLN
jgi:hypothetical protein